MKTKKIKQVGLIYVISFVVLFIISLWLSAHFVHLSWWIWGTSLCIAFVLLYVMVRYSVKYFLFLKFEEYLRRKIYKKWPRNTEFPLQEDIERWINNYRLSVEGRFSKFIWDKIMKTEEACIQDILKQLVVPVIGVERGLSLYDLHSAPTIDPSKVNDGNTIKESQEMGAYLEYLPVKSLVCCLQMPMQLTPPVLHRLLIRQDVVGNFDTTCRALMKANCEVVASIEAIDMLIAETKAAVPVKFPKEFLAYVIDKDPDVEKRKKVFDWYVSQEKQYIDRRFFLSWPQLTQEEITVIFKIFDEKEVLDQIFIHHQLWEHVSTECLKSECFRLLAKWKYYVNEEMFNEVLKRMK